MTANRIKELRKQKGITQCAIAEKLGVSQAQIARFESGVNDISTEQLGKIAEILGVKPYELLPKEWQPEELSEEEKEFLRLFRKSKATSNDTTSSDAASGQ